MSIVVNKDVSEKEFIGDFEIDNWEFGTAVIGDLRLKEEGKRVAS